MYDSYALPLAHRSVLGAVTLSSGCQRPRLRADRAGPLERYPAAFALSTVVVRLRRRRAGGRIGDVKAAMTIDDYLAGVPDDKRVALERLRRQIRAALPDAIETISYGRPTFKLNGRWFVAFGVAKNHCSFYAGAAPLEALAGELGGYRLWRGTINFAADRPLPDELVTKLLQVRLAEHRER